jgi:hypothetical protein
LFFPDNTNRLVGITDKNTNLSNLFVNEVNEEDFYLLWREFEASVKRVAPDEVKNRCESYQNFPDQATKSKNQTSLSALWVCG